MSDSSAHKILGIKPDAQETEIKKAYRNLAKIYHPDKNKSPGAAKKFLEITEAYEQLLKGKPIPYKRDEGYAQADEILRKQRERARQAARHREAKKKEDEEKFRKSELYDLLLLSKYFFNSLLLVFSIAAILVPVILGIFIDPVAFISTIYFVIIGVFLIWHIYGRRATWFKLGKFNSNYKSILSLFRKPAPHTSRDKCFYSNGDLADGKPYRINLILVLDYTSISLGAMNHNTRIKQKSHSLIIPRSAKAEFTHRLCSILKTFVIVTSVIFFPVSSIFWRFIAGIIISGTLSYIILKVKKVKSKTTFLFTPALLIKITIWILSVFGISTIGPGFDISINEYKYLLFAGLFFLTDMLFDLLFGFFPFYKKLFKPVFRQGKILSRLYSEGYQNYLEYPFYSVFFPLLKWIY